LETNIKSNHKNDLLRNNDFNLENLNNIIKMNKKLNPGSDKIFDKRGIGDQILINLNDIKTEKEKLKEDIYKDYAIKNPNENEILNIKSAKVNQDSIKNSNKLTNNKNYNSNPQAFLIKENEDVTNQINSSSNFKKRSINYGEKNDKCYYSLPPNNSEGIIFEDLEKKIFEKIDAIEDFSLIRKTWKFNLLGNFPTDQIRNYFGEKICFYFLFLSLYTKYLFFLSLIGIFVYIVQITDSYESYNIEFYSKNGFEKSNFIIIINTLYSFSVIIWSTLFLENWKKKQITAATIWGQLDFENQEVIMSTFRGKLRRSPINDEVNEIYNSLFRTFIRKIIAYVLSLVIVIIVVTLVIYLLFFRNWLVINKIWGTNNKIIQNVPSKFKNDYFYLFIYFKFFISQLIIKNLDLKILLNQFKIIFLFLKIYFYMI